MLLKPGVDISKLNREIRRALKKIEAAYPDFVVTSTYEGSHQPSSLHYCHDAIDIRDDNWVGEPIDPELLKQRLGIDFDVVKSANCIHIEYDPKG